MLRALFHFIASLIPLFLGGFGKRRALEDASRRLQDGDWEGAIEELRGAAHWGLGTDGGERALVAVLDVLEAQGFDVSGVHADYLGLASLSDSEIKGQGGVKGAVDFWVGSAKDEAFRLQGAQEVINSQFDRFWDSLPHLRAARKELAIEERPILSPDMLAPLVAEPEQEGDEGRSAAGLRVVRGLGGRFRVGAARSELMGEAHRLRASGAISDVVADALVSALIDLPGPGDRGPSQLWAPSSLSEAALRQRRRSLSGLIEQPPREASAA